ncbi:MAG: Ribosome-associated heat shock protein implicated in the recycling of the 50S subunit (S4 paralog), partial [uncultured Rubellimicrobium sp.]
WQRAARERRTGTGSASTSGSGARGWPRPAPPAPAWWRRAASVSIANPPRSRTRAFGRGTCLPSRSARRSGAPSGCGGCWGWRRGAGRRLRRAASTRTCRGRH